MKRKTNCIKNYELNCRTKRN